MKKTYDKVYQFKITLNGVNPPIWRRFQVPESYSFWDLHVAIQDAMGWLDTHLHQFSITDPTTGKLTEIGIPDDDFGGEQEIHPGWKVKMSNYFSLDNLTAQYTYDFGDDWQHILELEEILPRDDSKSYPICVAGKRACPPEDCGGVGGYEDMLEVIANPDHEEHEGMMEWLGTKYDPERFDPREVRFDDPAKRWKNAFS